MRRSSFAVTLQTSDSKFTKNKLSEQYFEKYMPE